MEKREKTEFILEQMRLCLLKKDYPRVQIVSKKINIKYFEHVDNQVRGGCVLRAPVPRACAVSNP